MYVCLETLSLTHTYALSQLSNPLTRLICLWPGDLPLWPGKIPLWPGDLLLWPGALHPWIPVIPRITPLMALMARLREQTRIQG